MGQLSFSTRRSATIVLLSGLLLSSCHRPRERAGDQSGSPATTADPDRQESTSAAEDDPVSVAVIERIDGKVKLNSAGRILSLDLSKSSVVDDDLIQLKGLSTIESLTLFGRQITDHGIAAISQLTTLKRLVLEKTNATDKILPKLAELHQLERLDLTLTNVTGEGLGHLTKLSQLEHLNLVRASDYTLE